MQQNLAPTLIEKACQWIVDLRYENIPEEVLEIAKLQLLDTFAAIAAGSRATVGVRLKKALEAMAEKGQSTVLPFGAEWPLEQCIYYHAATSNALELDNFSFMGHLSQSAVSVAFAVAEKLNASGKELLLALITAVEVTGRMGAYLAAGPQQGHMRSFIHRVGGAIAAGKLLKLTQAQMAQALAIGLSMPEFTLFPAAFSPDTKVICTSSASIEGMRAAFMAKEGITATLDILESPIGFLAYLTYIKEIPDLWGQLGKSWNLYAFSFKKYATCAYAQGPVNAALQIAREHQPQAAEIERVDILGPLVTVVMEKFSQPHHGAHITPVNTHFSTIRSVAAALLYGELTGDFYRDGNFESKIDEIHALSQKSHLSHAWELTAGFLRGMDQGIEGAGKRGVLGGDSAAKTLSRFKKAFGSRPMLRLSDVFELGRLNAPDRKYILRRFARAYRSRLPFFSQAQQLAYHSHEGDLRKMEFPLSGRVKVTMKDGRTFEGFCHIPPGFAGDPERMENGRIKYFRELQPVWGREKAEKVMHLVKKLDEYHTKDLIQLLKAPPS